MTLAENRDQVNRLYRSFFVYSIGFFQLVKGVVEDCKNSFVLSSSIWKVYMIILEYCNKVDYRTLISKLNIQNQRKVGEITKKFEYKIDKMNERIDENESEIKELETQMEKFKNENTLLKDKNEELNLRK